MPTSRAIVLLATIALATPSLADEPPTSRPVDPLTKFALPDDWEARFWGSPDAVALLEMSPERLAELVPVQAGLRHCRCPGCDAAEHDEPLGWSIKAPRVVTCKRCNATFPNDKIPAQVDKKVPEDTIEVVPGVIHHYPYHAVDAEKQLYDGERLYLNARRDYEAREYLAKAALYAAVRYRRQPLGEPDVTLARVASILLIRFAQVYPNYALHLDQPGEPKFLEPAHLAPPYRRGYGTAKWDWLGSLDVPLNLVVAYALIRDDPALIEAGQRLKVADPAGLIEHDLFRGSAAFVKDQPRELNEQELQVDRGLLSVARLLRDPALAAEATSRLREFSERGFYHDGLWRAGDVGGHRRVLGLLEGWIDRLMLPQVDPKVASTTAVALPILPLARLAGAAILAEPATPEIRQVGWPTPEDPGPSRAPTLLGGAGVARLAVGDGADALDLELRGMGSFGSARSRRMALRVAVGGRTILGDLDDQPPRPDGWDRASSSHNTVVVDGLNQRETPRLMREPVPGGEFLFFAADPDFQVVVLDDPRSYPRSATRYRQTVIACSGPKARYAVSVFEVDGGLQHDQFFHAATGDQARWATSVPMAPGPESLLPPTIPFLPNVRAEDGRWFVQSYGQFDRMTHGLAVAPGLAMLGEPGKARLRLHLLGDTPFHVVAGSTPRTSAADEPGRAALLLRRSSKGGATVESTFVTVFDPLGPGPGLGKVGRMTETPGFVVLYLETLDGPEHLIINLRPGEIRTIPLADGRDLSTDAFVVRARRDELMMAGGTVASVSGVAIRQPALTGRILASARFPTADSRGWFETDAAIPPDPSLVGRTLLIRHGDRSARGWTIARVEPGVDQRVRIHVKEEPGFLIEGADRIAHYYQFPNTANPGPHTFTIATIRR
jgi:hypothetical protein